MIMKRFAAIVSYDGTDFSVSRTSRDYGRFRASLKKRFIESINFASLVKAQDVLILVFTGSDR